jgi:hypothetical protein
MTISDQSTGKSLTQRWYWPFVGLLTPSPRVVLTVWGGRKPSETKMAMPFIARRMKISHAGLDDKSIDRITLPSRCYSSKE